MTITRTQVSQAFRAWSKIPGAGACPSWCEFPGHDWGLNTNTGLPVRRHVRSFGPVDVVSVETATADDITATAPDVVWFGDAVDCIDADNRVEAYRSLFRELQQAFAFVAQLRKSAPPPAGG